MAELTYRDAVARGIAQEMKRDKDVVFLGEDIAKAGGVFKATVGLYEQFGPLRVRDTPISEQAILGAAMGAAMTGLKPIAEIMFSDFIAVCFDYLANEFAKSRYMSNGQTKCPLVVRTGNGAGSRFGAQHSQSVEKLVHDDSGAEGGRALEPARCGRTAGCGGPRSRPRHLLRAQIALSHQG
jgi:pyruvate dehydrogenase E1 component beta subunit